MVKKGDKLGRHRVLKVVTLSNGWQIAKTENRKSPQDFRVKLVSPEHPRGLTVKHAHFGMDFYGKLCYDKKKSSDFLDGLVKVWQGEDVKNVLKMYANKLKNLPGYAPEYVFYAMRWILQQEDINFGGRSPDKQKEIDDLLQPRGISTPKGRKGSELAISLFCGLFEGEHPVEALRRTGLRI